MINFPANWKKQTFTSQGYIVPVEKAKSICEECIEF
jgi:hypothetical protein